MSDRSVEVVRAHRVAVGDVLVSPDTEHEVIDLGRNLGRTVDLLVLIDGRAEWIDYWREEWVGIYRRR